MNKLQKAASDLKINQIAVAGGVSANSALRSTLIDYGNKYNWETYIPPFSFTTDNAAMVAISGYFKYLKKNFCSMNVSAFSRVEI